MTPDDYAEIAKRLDRLAPVPDEVLADVVTREGLCFWMFDRDEIPELSGEDVPDRELAAWMCAGCPVIDECLELELRTAGEHTVGVWGALADTDRRAVHRLWRWRRNRPEGGAR
ncbi:WhiB family transcriptional regulator [Amycolatopsis pithecellobii]|uniref:WhiB family transcriptional regulator n=1 Tax=Amycolatopsis pithecellobii TaxID=664692 RepID=A0A6N7YM89_9PSEU|nr:WhiB family transcriptional regulator [Amycolatopsis pithecellobii]MTD54077.1 WhiB family transcriptional regulator [Amycolatopsis pithecellobii]